jgi:hypothetical protein
LTDFAPSILVRATTHKESPMRLSPAALALAGLLSLSAAPAFAGAAETAFLNKFAGKWTGGGQVTGEHAGPLDCKLTIRPVTAGLNFRGSCNMEGMTMSSTIFLEELP